MSTSRRRAIALLHGGSLTRSPVRRPPGDRPATSVRPAARMPAVVDGTHVPTGAAAVGLTPCARDRSRSPGPEEPVAAGGLVYTGEAFFDPSTGP